MELKFLKIYLLIDIILVILSLIIGNNWLVNTQISFVISVFIVYVNFRNYKNMIENELRSGKYDNVGDEDENVKIGFVKNGFTFFSPLKILGYFTLGLFFYLLSKFQIINPLAFLVGILPLPIGSLICGAMNAKP